MSILPQPNQPHAALNANASSGITLPSSGTPTAGNPTVCLLVRMDWLDLREGRPGDLFGCPLGLAIARALGRPVKVRCDGVEVLGSIFEPRAVLTLPEEAQEWLIIHDVSGGGEPLTFTLNVPRAILDDRALRRNEHEWEQARMRPMKGMVQSVGTSTPRKLVLTVALRERIARALGLTWATAHGATLSGATLKGAHYKGGVS